MSRTQTKQYQISGSTLYDDSRTIGSTMEQSYDIQLELNDIRTLLKNHNSRSGNWYDDLTAINGVQRDLYQVHLLVDAAISGTQYHSNFVVETGGAVITGNLDTSGATWLGLAGGAADTIVRGDLAVKENLTVTGIADFNGSVDADVTTFDVWASGNIELETSGSGTSDLILSGGGGQILFDDSFREESSYTQQLELAASTAEWDAYATNFGATTSLLNAIAIASASGGDISTEISKQYYTVTGTHGAGVDLALGWTYSLSKFNTDDVDIFLNGTLLRSGTTFDVYNSGQYASGSLRFTFDLYANDLITLQQFGT